MHINVAGSRTAICCINVGQQLTCRITQDDVEVMTNSPISMTNAHFYKQDRVQDQYNNLVLHFARKWNLDVRTYSDGVAYHFVSPRKGKSEIKDEEANFQFTSHR